MLEAGTHKRWRMVATHDTGDDPSLTPDVGSPHNTVGDAADLARKLRVTPLAAALLLNRGLVDIDEAQRFLDPKLTHLHDPALMPGAIAAAERMAEAVNTGQPIVIYGDYDVDGVTASSILWQVLHAAGAHVVTYVPHRLEEGYGINAEAITQLAAGTVAGGRDEPVELNATPLIISVDCGITAVEPANIAKQLGVDLIITDHHEMSDQLPDAHTLVHPRLPGSTYPWGELCGAGVALKLAWQFARVHCGSSRLPDKFRDVMLDCVSLAALGTIADIVPLVDENRVIAHFGLGQIKRTRITGLNAMIDAASLRDEKVDAYHVGFVLGPRLNACGRMGHAFHAVKMFTTDDAAAAAETAAFLAGENDARRHIEKQIFNEAAEQVIDAGYDADDCRAIVVAKEGWHAGVVGIVASRLVERFARPAFVLNIDEEGKAHGSARSVDGISVHETLTHCAEYLTGFGGHAMAAGLHLEAARLDDFRAAVVAHINSQLGADDLSHIVDIDAECELGDLSVEAITQVHRLAPFGRDNPSPTICIRGVTLDRPATRVGKAADHLRLSMRQNGRFMSAIGWRMAESGADLPGGVRLDVVVKPKLGTWRGQPQVDLHLEDFKRSESVATATTGEAHFRNRS